MKDGVLVLLLPWMLNNTFSSVTMNCSPSGIFFFGGGGGGGRYSPPLAQDLLINKVSKSHTTTHHSRKDSSGRIISSSKRPPPDNTQHSRQTDIHAPVMTRTRNLSKRAAADLRLRPVSGTFNDNLYTWTYTDCHTLWSASLFVSVNHSTLPVC